MSNRDSAKSGIAQYTGTGRKGTRYLYALLVVPGYQYYTAVGAAGGGNAPRPAAIDDQTRKSGIEARERIERDGEGEGSEEEASRGFTGCRGVE
eukprot:COSAG02_NODE_5367_length_4395_cov_5.334963_5_plen_94_part_00